MVQRRKFKNQWLLLPILIMLVILISGAFKSETFTQNVHVTSETALGLSFAPIRPVTKSLLELGKMDEQNKHVLFLNKVAYCGSEVVILLLEKLQGFNGFKHVRIGGGSRNKVQLTRFEQEQFVDDFFDIIRSKAVPISLDAETPFINFATFGKQFPTFINIIREPADKILSRSVYHQKNNLVKCIEKGKSKCHEYIRMDDLTVPFFCGHDSRCLEQPKWGFEIAKQNVESYYSVVGVLEELNATLEIYENELPFFFRGVQKVYNAEIKNKYILKDNVLKNAKNATFKQELRKLLKYEYEFYDWIKSRLFQQVQFLYGEHHQH